jgi:hypothetical protein
MATAAVPAAPASRKRLRASLAGAAIRFAIEFAFSVRPRKIIGGDSRLQPI